MEKKKSVADDDINCLLKKKKKKNPQGLDLHILNHPDIPKRNHTWS